MVRIPTERNLAGFWHALTATGSDAGEGAYANVAGNQLGSWLVRINYDADRWKAAIYADHYFEDHSQMFLLDYNGYGKGVNWNKKNEKPFLYVFVEGYHAGLRTESEVFTLAEKRSVRVSLY